VAAVAFAAAALAALGLSPVGEAIARGVSDFSAWLTGTPGEPASEDAQRAFEDERSWADFPDGPQLRRLIVAKAAGGTFELFGFRTGDSLCLRLTVKGIETEGPATGCAPLGELRRAEAPALAVLLDHAFGRQDVRPTDEGFIPPLASASFGVVADGVDAVELETNEGRAQATVASNAFLAVAEKPPLGMRTKQLTVLGAQGQQKTIAVAESPFGDYGPQAIPGIAPGPRKVERRVDGGTVGWLVGREPRGQSLEEARIAIGHIFLGGEIRFARVVTPDPSSYRRFAVGLVHVEKSKRQPWLGAQGDEFLCLALLEPGGGGGGGCSPVDAYFSRGPFTLGIYVADGGDQYALLDGLASDDVAGIELYLANGEQVAVPLKDNVYAIEVARSKFPVRLVARDDDGRVIGIETYNHDPLADPGPRPIEDKQRVVKRVVGANGTEGVLRVGPSTAGTRCWRVNLTGGAGGGGCLPKGFKEQLALGVNNSGEESFLSGTVAPGTTTLELHFRNGETGTVATTEGAVLMPLTREQAESGGIKIAIARDKSGNEVGRQRFRPLP
jgi:hypothetical protein